MGYSMDVVELGRKLVEQGKTLQEVRAATGAPVSLRTYEQWREHAAAHMPKLDDMMEMLDRQFDRLDVIASERPRLEEEEAKIRAFLTRLNIQQRPQVDAVQGYAAQAKAAAVGAA